MKKVFVAALALMSLTVLGAQQQQVLELSLEQAIDIALTENPTIKIADLEIERQDYARKEMQGNLYPTLSASGQYVRGIVKQEIFKGTTMGADNMITAAANLTIPLYVPAVYASLKVSRLQMESAVESARGSKITLVNEVKKAYYDILYAERALEVLLESEQLSQEVVDNIQVLYDNQMQSEYDLLTAQVQVSTLQPNIIQTRNVIELAKLMLKMYLGLPEDMDIVLTEDLDTYADKIFFYDNSLDVDISNNSDVRMLEIQSRMMDEQIKLIKKQYHPTVAAFGQFSASGSDLQMSGFGGLLDIESIPPGLAGMLPPGVLEEILGMFSSPAPSKGMWWQYPINLGVQVSVPIFTGTKTHNQVRQAKVAKNQLLLQKDYAEEGLRMQARAAMSNLIAAQESMIAAEKTMTQATKAYEITDVMYKQGAATILELNSAQLSLTQSQLNHTQALYNYITAQADYEKAVGYDYGIYE